jgi:hypothetical protein
LPIPAASCTAAAAAPDIAARAAAANCACLPQAADRELDLAGAAAARPRGSDQAKRSVSKR